MKVELSRGNLKCVAEGTAAEIIKQFSDFTETFQDYTCGACGSENVDYQVRKVEDNEFYEQVCRNPKCRARLSFGHSKKDSKVYPKRVVTDNKGKAIKDDNGKAQWLENNGWLIYKGEKKE
jgi:hypothetical protein